MATKQRLYALVSSGPAADVYKATRPVLLRNLGGVVTAFRREGELVRVRPGEKPAANIRGEPVYRLLGARELIEECAKSAGPKPKDFAGNVDEEVYAKLDAEITTAPATIILRLDSLDHAAQVMRRASSLGGRRLNLGGASVTISGASLAKHHE